MKPMDSVPCLSTSPTSSFQSSFSESSHTLSLIHIFYEVDPESFGAYAYSYMSTAASYVYSFYGRFTQAIQ